MEAQKPNFKSFAYNNGLYLGVLSVIILVLMYVLDLERSWYLSVISLTLTAVIYIMAFKSYKHANGGLMSLGEALKLGLAIAAIGGIIGGLYAYIHYSYIQPEFIEAIREESLRQMVERNPDLTSEEIAQGTKMTNLFTSPFVLSTFSLIGSLFVGLIISVIGGLIYKEDSD